MSERSSVDYWTESMEETVRLLRTDEKKGLTREEAAVRLSEGKGNRLAEPEKISLVSIFLDQFRSLIVWVLIAAALIAAFLGEWVDAGAIGVISILNALLGFVQEWRSARALESLTRFDRPTARVIREGQTSFIPAEEIVPGDLLLLEAGDAVPADARLVSAYRLAAQEAALTGESLPREKSCDTLASSRLVPGDRVNMLFRGTTISAGSARAIVTATGPDTEIGRIATLLQSVEKTETPLQRRLAELGNRLVFLAIAIVALLFLLGLVRGYDQYEMFMTSLSLAVAAIPEGLPAVVTVALAVGMRRMASRKALMRRLSAVETLGCTTVICTDKTGTLTENKMRVKQLYVDGQRLTMTGEGYSPIGSIDAEGDKPNSETLQRLLTAVRLCNHATLEEKEGSWEITGDPTEAALLVAAKLGGEGECSELVESEVPFDADRRRMSVLTADHLYTKGAPGTILALSAFEEIGGEVVDLTEERRRKLQEEIDALSAQGLRLIAVSYRKRAEGESEEQLIFLGLLAMRDPPREEAKEAVARCLAAGIRPIMVTGDNRLTAMAIAKELCFPDGEGAIDGHELDALSQEQLGEKIRSTHLFARVSPAHKLRIVDALQSQGEVVAMTGDGVNDAPAIEQADIGVGMGITGTDVTKSVSDMVVLDDNFASIVQAVREGRGIYDNIVKFSGYLLSCNLGEVLVVLFGLLFLPGGSDATVMILAPIHLLWVNLITDGFPALALAFDPLAPRAMERPPRPPQAPLLGRSLLMGLFLNSLFIAAATVITFALLLPEGAERARTSAFTMLVVLELTKPFLLRQTYGVGLFSNLLLIAAVALSFLLQLGALYLPMAQHPLKTVPLPMVDWLRFAVVALLFWLFGQLVLRITSSFSSRGSD